MCYPVQSQLGMIYVDNSHTTGKLLERCFPGMPPGGGIKEDLFHVERRITDTLPSDHSLRGMSNCQRVVLSGGRAHLVTVCLLFDGDCSDVHR